MLTGSNSYNCLLVVIYRENGDHIRHGGGIEEGAQSDSKHSQASSVTEKRGKSLSFISGITESSTDPPAVPPAGSTAGGSVEGCGGGSIEATRRLYTTELADCGWVGRRPLSGTIT